MNYLKRLSDSKPYVAKQIFRLSVVLVVVWCFSVGNGVYLMSSFENTPGVRGSVPARWPEASNLPHHADQATLVFFAHPRCPCTSASLEQLKRVLAAAQLPVQCDVVFLVPSVASDDWTDSPSVKSAKSLPSTSVTFDQGDEMRRFGATTSGLVLLFDTSNQLVYSGGVTVARGQAGDSGGSQSLVRLLNRQNATIQSAPVFGCPLFQNIHENSSVGDVVPCQKS